MRNMDIMGILHKENNHDKINMLEEIETPKSVTSLDLLNDTINGRNDPLYRIFTLSWNILKTDQHRFTKNKSPGGMILHLFKWDYGE